MPFPKSKGQDLIAQKSVKLRNLRLTLRKLFHIITLALAGVDTKQGKVSERSKELASKSSDSKGFAGSNPALSVTENAHPFPVKIS